MADPSLALILTILREEAEEEKQQHKGKQKEGALSDTEAALQAWQREIDEYSSFLEDHTLARSIALAVQNDGVAVTRAMQEETRASDDRRLALRLSGHPLPHPPSPPASPKQVVPESILEGFVDLTISNNHKPRPRQFNEHAPAESSKDAERRALSAPSTTEQFYECVACADIQQLPDIIQAPCFHMYCRTCAVKLFQDSMTDESLFPPRCCRQEIPLSDVSGFFNLAMICEFEEKTIEFSDPHRTYCSNHVCSRYILPLPDAISCYVGTCSHCASRTCMLCKRPAHEGECPDEDKEVLQLSEREGWRQCFQCRNMIELVVGCNHITCRCGAEFCYVCGTKWRQCRCEIWDETRLLDRARHLVVRGRDPAQPPVAARPEEVRQMARWLRERHECDHEGFWPRINGRHRCEECHYNLPNYILQCERCGIQACRRCRLNRL